MKKIFKLFIALIIIAILFIIGKLLWTNFLKPLEIPELNSQSKEYGELINSEDISQNYEIYSQKISSYDFVDLDVNAYIDSLILGVKNDSNSSNKVLSKDKYVFKNVIDTYKANDNIVSVKITIMAKKLYEDNYSTTIKTFNYYLDEQRQISLDELFKSGYKENISDIYSDTYLLKSKQVEFYNGEESVACTYNSLKEYTSSKLLTALNLDVSEEEYNKMFSRVVDKTKKMVAITLDDGPHATNTEKILDILDSHNARATFFMLGENVVNNKGVVKKVYDSGNEIGIHTWDHKQLTKLTTQEIINEVENTSDAICEITGERPKLVRPPYGSVNSTVKEAINYPLILWNIDSLDWKSRDENQIVPLVMGDVQDGDIILLHDIHSTTVPAVEKIVTQLDEAGYQMVTVSELLEAKGYDTTTTKVFYSGRQ